MSPRRPDPRGRLAAKPSPDRRSTVRILVTGPEGVNPSEVGAALAALTGLELVDARHALEDLDAEQTGRRRTRAELARSLNREEFRRLERETAVRFASRDWCILAIDGSVLLDPESRRPLRADSVIVFLTASPEELWAASRKSGLPPWFEGEEGRRRFEEEAARIDEILCPFADVVVATTGLSTTEAAEQAAERIGQELAICVRAANTFGEVIRVTTFGESHGPAIGVVLDGVRPGIEISLDDVQREMDRRRPGQSAVTTPRQEADRVHVLSGLFEGKTTGAPIAMVIYSRDQDPSKYEGLRDVFRPGHADFTYYRKYGVRDHRGGGRSSGRETAGRVAAGAVAKQILAQRGVRIFAHAVEIAGVRAETCDYGAIETNPVRCADAEAAKRMEAAILAAREANDSVGGIVQLDILGVPAGLGDPVFGKLDARLTGAVMTIAAVKGIEVGRGFELARMRGSEANDQMAAPDRFLTNNAGGILGGISTGEPILIRLVVKPTSSIARPQRTVDTAGRERQIEVHGRHDPCIVPRVIPVVETMAALVLLDAWEIQARIRPGSPGQPSP